MSRAERFDKLESEREGRPDVERDGDAPSVPEERFAAPPPRPSDEPQPHLPERALTRFEADGANHLSLDNDELIRLPFRRCARCHRDSSKFDTVCIFCGASLETVEARELNRLILSTREEQKEAETSRALAEHQAHIRELIDGQFEKAVEEEAAATRRLSLRVRGLAVAGAVLCFALAVWAASWCVSGVLVTAGLALAVVALPRAVLTVLSASRRRWRSF